MKKIFFYIFIGVFILNGCKKEADSQTDETKAEQVVDSLKKKAVEPTPDIVAEMEPEDRVIWQKPDLVINKLGNLSGKTIVDIGAGTGYFAFRLAQKGARVIAVDIDPQAIEWMEKQKSKVPLETQKRIDIRLATETDAKILPEEVDVALIVNTYIYIDDRVNYMKNLKKGLKPGAKIVIVDFKKKNTPIGPDLSQRISLLELENELVEAGFTILNEDDTSLEYQYFISAIYNPK